MKLILAVIPNEDGAKTTSALTHEGFAVTKLSTTGGFLLIGNTTLLIGTEEENVPRVKEIIEKICGKRSLTPDTRETFGKGLKSGEPAQTHITGGAAVFVLNVEEYDKI